MTSSSRLVAEPSCRFRESLTNWPRDSELQVGIQKGCFPFWNRYFYTRNCTQKGDTYFNESLEI